MKLLDRLALSDSLRLVLLVPAWPYQWLMNRRMTAIFGADDPTPVVEIRCETASLKEGDVIMVKSPGLEQSSIDAVSAFASRHGVIAMAAGDYVIFKAPDQQTS